MRGNGEQVVEKYAKLRTVCFAVYNVWLSFDKNDCHLMIYSSVPTKTSVMSVAGIFVSFARSTPLL